ncbi:MAG: AmmeMemoRadiSam system protein B [Deltaproteobacteria bacterium RBG_13_52_11]|nr:MAG: AmmeMemoRadiSam system protein B [Deltaproteobacteria bacterium RBG_13_52_11]
MVVIGEHREQEHPKARPLEAFPTQVEGREMIGIKDPTGICPAIVCVKPEAFFLITLMDGTNSLRDLQAAYMRKYGTLLLSDTIEGLIEQLNSHYLLETHHFQDYIRQLQEDFKNARTRKAAYAGTGYEADPRQLKAQLRGYFQGEDGPGLPEEGAEKKALKGIVAPHIDFTRGGACYAHAYKALGESTGADLYIILGTCHTPLQYPFAFTLKSFETPLGQVEVEEDVVEAIAGRLPFDPFLDEFSHRSEHTIEFQVIFLQYLLGERGFKIFPILCNSFHEMIQEGISPMQDPLYKDAISILAHGCKQLPKTCLIASADLAHVGPQFGHTEVVTPGVLAKVKAKDLEMLHYGEALKGEEFYQFILREGDRRNICGLPPLYALLHLIDAQKGELLRYQQWSDTSGKGAVTFAGMAFS